MVLNIASQEADTISKDSYEHNLVPASYAGRHACTGNRAFSWVPCASSEVIKMTTIITGSFEMVVNGADPTELPNLQYSKLDTFLMFIQAK